MLLLNCMAGMFATTFTATILTVSIPRVSSDLHSTPAVISWVITAPMLAGAIAMPVLGRLGDIRGHRRVYLTGFGLAIIFCVLTAFAQSPAWLIAGRTLAQLAGSSTVPASFAMLFQSFPPGERVRASAWASATLSGASVTGLVIGGPIIDSIGWRPLFLIQAALATAALLPAIIVLRPDRPRDEKVPIDRSGAVLLAITAFCVTFGINRITADGPSPIDLILLAVSPIGAWLLVRAERASPHPLIPRRLAQNRNVWLATVSSFALGASWMGSFVVTPLLLETVFGYSATTTSLITLCRTGSIVLAAPVASRLGSRFGERPTLIASASVTAGSMVLLALGAWNGSVTVVVGGLLLGGWAWGHAQPAMVAVMANSVEPDDFGVATSLQQTATQMGSVVSVGLLTAIAADATTRGPYAEAYLVTAAFATAGAGVATRVRSSERLVATGLVGEDEMEPFAVVREEFTPRAGST
jgi:MFS family permease